MGRGTPVAALLRVGFGVAVFAERLAVGDYIPQLRVCIRVSVCICVLDVVRYDGRNRLAVWKPAPVASADFAHMARLFQHGLAPLLVAFAMVKRIRSAHAIISPLIPPGPATEEVIPHAVSVRTCAGVLTLTKRARAAYRARTFDSLIITYVKADKPDKADKADIIF